MVTPNRLTHTLSHWPARMSRPVKGLNTGVMASRSNCTVHRLTGLGATVGVIVGVGVMVGGVYVGLGVLGVTFAIATPVPVTVSAATERVTAAILRLICIL
jgi:uncharacterized membrane protein YkgB